MGSSVFAALAVRLSLEGENFKKGLKEGKKNLIDFKSTAKNLMKSMAALWSIKKVAEFGKELLDIQLKVEGIERAFERFAPEGYMEDLKIATSGAVSEMDLMQKAVQAKNLGLPIQQLSTFFRFATIRAAETGESIDYLVDSIVKGIGRKSVLILDNLGLSATRINDEFQKTGDYSAAVGKIIREELEGIGDVADLNVQRVGRITAEWENAKKAMGEKLRPAMTETLKEWVTEFDIWQDDELSFIQKITYALSDKATALYRNRKERDAYYKAQEKHAALQKKLAEEEKKELPILETLAAQLKSAKDTRDKAITEDDIIKQNKYIQNLEKEIKKYEELGEVVEEPDRPHENIKIDLVPKLEIGSGDVSDYTEFGFIEEIVGDVSSEIDNILAQQEDVIAERLASINEIIQSGFQDAVSGMAEGIGDLIVSGELDPSSFLEPLADMAIQLGELAIATGIGIEAIKKAFLGNPAAAIAAGIALVALGTAVKSSLSSISSSVGSSSSTAVETTTESVTSGSSSTSSDLYDRSLQQVDVVVEGTLKGKDIYLSSQRYEQTKKLTT